MPKQKLNTMQQKPKHKLKHMLKLKLQQMPRLTLLLKLQQMLLKLQQMPLKLHQHNKKNRQQLNLQQKLLSD